MFIKNIKKHIIKLRAQNIYKVASARTARLKHSAIPFMQKHFNKKHKERQIMAK